MIAEKWCARKKKNSIGKVIPQPNIVLRSVAIQSAIPGNRSYIFNSKSKTTNLGLVMFSARNAPPVSRSVAILTRPEMHLHGATCGGDTFPLSLRSAAPG
jgi:hypothetical protein